MSLRRLRTIRMEQLHAGNGTERASWLNLHPAVKKWHRRLPHTFSGFTCNVRLGLFPASSEGGGQVTALRTATLRIEDLRFCGTSYTGSLIQYA